MRHNEINASNRACPKSAGPFFFLLSKLYVYYLCIPRYALCKVPFRFSNCSLPWRPHLNSMKWSPNLGPMGVSRNRVVLDWLRQPGNCERFMQAGCRSKRLGAVNENKTEVAGLVCTLLQNAGFRGITPQAVVVKLTSLIKSYKRAHALAASGGMYEGNDDYQHCIALHFDSDCIYT